MKKLIFTLLTLVWLAGCTTIAPSTTNVEWQAHQTRLNELTDYEVSGKLGYIAPDQRQSLNFHWSHSDQSSQLRLTTFLGQTVLNLEINPYLAKVRTHDGGIYTDVSADNLVYHLTGLSIPIEDLQDWLLGKPSNADKYLLNENNTLASLDKVVSRQPWQLDYARYMDIDLDQQPLPLPNSLKLTNQDIKLNILVSKWDIKQ